MANHMTDTDSMVAAFIARHGVTKVAIGEYAIEGRIDTRRSYADATSENDLIQQRMTIVGSNGRLYVTNGLGERIS
jgi:hypothetical protein